MVINVILEEDNVKSFNGRTGDVVPQNGDYTANMVGAIASDQIRYGTADIGVNAALATGTFYFVYE